MQPRFKPSGLPTEKVVRLDDAPQVNPPEHPDYAIKQMRILPDDVDFDTIAKSVRWVESAGGKYNYNPKSGAIGPMQTMPATLGNPGYGVRPARNNSVQEMERVGRDYLKAMIKHYGDVNYGLAAYNWGPGNVNKWIARGADPSRLPKETREYIPKVHNAYTGYGGKIAQRQLEEIDEQAPAIAEEQRTYTEQVSIIPRGIAGFHYQEEQIIPTTFTRKYKPTDMAEQTETMPTPTHKFVPDIKAFALGVGGSVPKKAEGIDPREIARESAMRGIDRETMTDEEKALQEQKDQQRHRQTKAEQTQNIIEMIKVIVGGLLAFGGGTLLVKAVKEKMKKVKGKTGAGAMLDVGLYPIRRNMLNTVAEKLNDAYGPGHKVSGMDIIDADGRVVITGSEIDKMIIGQEIFEKEEDRQSL